MTRQHHERQLTHYQNDKERDCHRALKTSSYEKYKNINPDRVADTCMWVLNHPQYRQWQSNSHNDLLWISADPGCGKSVLSKSLIDNELRSTSTHTVCYFFFKDNEEQDNLATALCAVLHQLFGSQPHLIRHAMTAWEEDGNKLTQEVDELWRIYLAATTDIEAHNVSCVLDALDECREDDRRRLISKLANFYVNSSSSRPGRGWLKILVTSRPYDDIQSAFQEIPSSLPMIRLRGEEENDQIRQEIDVVIGVRVAKLAQDLKLKETTRNQLEQKLLRMENRTYLWLYLATEGIYQTYRDSLRPDEESIESLPASVEDAYEKILGKVSGKQTQVVRKILQIVVGARRPLSLSEMAIALGVATSTQLKSSRHLGINKSHLQQNIRQWCGLFVFIDRSSKIYLIHQTAKEFLVSGSGVAMASRSGWKYCLDWTGIEECMTQICVEYLLLEDLQKKDSQDDQDPAASPAEGQDCRGDIQGFLKYSAQNWPSHLRNMHIEAHDVLMIKVRRLYDTSSERFHGFRYCGQSSDRMRTCRT